MFALHPRGRMGSTNSSTPALRAQPLPGRALWTAGPAPLHDQPAQRRRSARLARPDLLLRLQRPGRPARRRRRIGVDGGPRRAERWPAGSRLRWVSPPSISRTRDLRLEGLRLGTADPCWRASSRRRGARRARCRPSCKAAAQLRLPAAARTPRSPGCAAKSPFRRSVRWRRHAASCGSTPCCPLEAPAAAAVDVRPPPGPARVGPAITEIAARISAFSQRPGGGRATS